MKPVERLSLTETVVARLQDEIMSGRWALGDRIPNEAGLCEMLAVSRGTVREAVRAMVMKGLLETRQGSGTFVVSTVDPAESFARITHLSLRDRFEARTALEAEAVRLAAVRKTPEDIAHLRDLLTIRGEYSFDNADNYVENDFRFHQAIVALGKNQALIELYAFFSTSIRETILSTLDGPLIEPDMEAHAKIIDAINTGDPHIAANALRDFMKPMMMQIDELLRVSP